MESARLRLRTSQIEREVAKAREDHEQVRKAQSKRIREAELFVRSSLAGAERLQRQDEHRQALVRRLQVMEQQHRDLDAMLQVAERQLLG